MTVVADWKCKTCDRRKQDVFENGCETCSVCPLEPVDRRGRVIAYEDMELPGTGHPWAWALAAIVAAGVLWASAVAVDEVTRSLKAL